MTDYREILRLGSLNYNQRSIAQSAGCSRNTVEKVLRTASAKGVQWPVMSSSSGQLISIGLSWKNSNYTHRLWDGIMGMYFRAE